MAIHQEGTTPPPPEKRRTLEDGIILSVRTDRVKFKGFKEGVADVEIKKEDESLYMKDGAVHIDLDASKS